MVSADSSSEAQLDVVRSMFVKLSALGFSFLESERATLSELVSAIGAQLPFSKSADIGQKLAEFEKSLDTRELSVFRTLLSVAVSELCKNSHPPTPGTARYDAYASALRCLSGHTEQEKVIYCGYLPFIDEKVLASLREEARSTRFHADDCDRYWMATAGTVGRELAESPRLLDFVSERVGSVRPSGDPAYIFYDGKNSGVDPHIDQDKYALHCLVGVERSSEATSHLSIYYPDQPVQYVKYLPGEIVLFHSGRIVHGRDNLDTKEKVTILSIGFEIV